VGSNAFAGLSASITISGNIPPSTFNGVTKSTDVVIGTSTTIIKDYAFSNFKGLRSISIPNNVTIIGISAFQDCSKLSNITILSNSITSVGTNAFNGLASIVTIYGNVPSNMFNGVTKSTDIIIRENTIINDNAFINFSGLKTVTIHNTVINIGTSAFKNCANLKSINIPNNITTMRDSMFENCTNLNSVNIPESVTSIGINAFKSCSTIALLTIPKNIVSIGNSAFVNCNKLKNIYFLCNKNFDLNNIINNNTLVIYYTENTTGWVSSTTPYKIYPAPKITNNDNRNIYGTCDKNISNIYLYNLTNNKQYTITPKNGSWTYKYTNSGNYSSIGFFYDSINYASYSRNI
jgi:hypothetical protein